jgi:pantetheine-phosphate adenylyltransferase
MNKYKLVACGGTFDLFHAGHKAFIQGVLNQSEKVILGITSDLYVKSFKDGNKVESFEFRRNAVRNFLNSIDAENRVQISPIDNFYGPLLTSDFNVQAVAVTLQTESMVTEINQKRKEKNLPELKVILLSLKLAEDGKILSATRIRKGEINRDGRLYLNPQWQNKILILPENLRSALQHPWAQVLSEVPEEIIGAKTIAIGDITVQNFNKKNVSQYLSIVDFLVKRQVKFHELSELGLTDENVLKVKNPHGTITPELFSTIQNAFKTKERKVILVDGEEDLAFLPVLLIAPLGFVAFYGQPNQGMVQVNVTEENKEKVYQIVSKFEISD